MYTTTTISYNQDVVTPTAPITMNFLQSAASLLQVSSCCFHVTNFESYYIIRQWQYLHCKDNSAQTSGI